MSPGVVPIQHQAGLHHLKTCYCEIVIVSFFSHPPTHNYYCHDDWWLVLLQLRNTHIRTHTHTHTHKQSQDKYENEDLIRYGLPEDVWFHVDDLSSAHVYLRMKPGMTLDGVPDDVVLDCASLVKANSIQGCKRSSVPVVYTRWKNLKKTHSMVDGQVGFHRPENVRRIEVEKNGPIVRGTCVNHHRHRMNVSFFLAVHWKWVGE